MLIVSRGFATHTSENTLSRTLQQAVEASYISKISHQELLSYQLIHMVEFITLDSDNHRCFHILGIAIPCHRLRLLYSAHEMK